LHSLYAVKHMTLREARDWRGYTQEELADLAGVDQATVSRIEKGERLNPSNSTVQRLELALRLKRGTLVFGQVMERTA
jgi:transcriptional regulator with XRE-family HTH domain